MTTPGAQAGLAAAITTELDELLAPADAELERRYPGERPGRQPVHTAYVPADKLRSGTVAGWGRAALAALDEFAPGPEELGRAIGVAPELAAQVLPLVRAKLVTEPVEDLRIDFEDGYRPRTQHPDQREDYVARWAAFFAGKAVRAEGGPPFIGIRCKSLEHATRRRAIATLELFLSACVERGSLPAEFLITVPKVSSAAQVEAMVIVCERLESAYGLSPGRLRFEIQVETPQVIVGPAGAATIAACIHAAAGRLTGLHYGTYDYSASLGIAAACQSLEHPAADHARSVMQVAAAGTGVRLSDGSVSVLPVGSRDEITAGWRLHARLIRRSLERGFYQGWDLHPAQLVSRYAATYAFFREGLPQACARLRDYAHRARLGQEEPATAKALASYLLRALDCGATTADEITTQTSLTRPELDQLSRTGQPR